MYDALAKIYDEFITDIDYKSWANDIGNKIKKYNRGKNILDIACGTGNLTCQLAKNGYEMVGIDISEQMLMNAQKRMRDLGVKCMFLKHDMKNFDIGKRFDSIICTCDGFNYLLEDKDVSSFFKCCYNTLKKDGILIFDISSDNKLKNKLGNNDYFDIREDKCLLWQNTIKDDIITLDLTMFIKNENGSYDRLEENQKQRIYTKDKVESILNGFEILECTKVCYNDKKDDERLQFIVKKI